MTHLKPVCQVESTDVVGVGEHVASNVKPFTLQGPNLFSFHEYNDEKPNTDTNIDCCKNCIACLKKTENKWEDVWNLKGFSHQFFKLRKRVNF